MWLCRVGVQVVFRRGCPAPEAAGAHVGRPAQSPAPSPQTENRGRFLEDNRTRAHIQTRTRGSVWKQTRDLYDGLVSHLIRIGKVSVI